MAPLQKNDDPKPISPPERLQYDSQIAGAHHTVIKKAATLLLIGIGTDQEGDHRLLRKGDLPDHRLLQKMT